jgi:aminopeptidase
LSDGALVSDSDRVHRLAELVVRFGANVQPGQIVSISSEPGKEQLARAIAGVAYAAGAKFVDLRVFDLHFKRARAIHADADTLSYVPPWYGQQILSLGAHRSAVITLTGPVEPHLMEGVDPQRLGQDMLPRVRESEQVLNDGTLNWTVAPCPTPGWAKLVHPDLDDAAALEQLWSDIAHVCRLDEADPVAAWNKRLDRLIEVAQTLTALRLDSLHFKGPGTDLTIGLLSTSRWTGARISTADGIVHAPNLPTEEVFTTPDPERTSGIVTSTKPLFVAGALITGLRVRFESGRAVEIEAEHGAATLRALADRGLGAARLGEVALVDRESRIGQLGTVFFDTLLDENAASHIALGAGLEMALDGDADHARMNRSEIHIDFMIGSDEVAVTGTTSDGSEIPLLRGGAWQV